MARILKEWGLGGELKILPYTEDMDHFKRYTSFYIEDKKKTVESYKDLKPFLIVKLEGMNSPEEASCMRNRWLEVDRAQIETEFPLIEDFRGLSVICAFSGKKIGVITDYYEGGHEGFFEVTREKKKILVPATSSYWRKPETEERIVYMEDEEGLFKDDLCK